MNPANYVVGEGELTGFTDSDTATAVGEASAAAVVRPALWRWCRASVRGLDSRVERVRPCEGRLWVSSIPGSIMDSNWVWVQNGCCPRWTD